MVSPWSQVEVSRRRAVAENSWMSPSCWVGEGGVDEQMSRVQQMRQPSGRHDSVTAAEAATCNQPISSSHK